MANLNDIAEALDPWACQVAVAAIAAMLGSESEWDSEAVEWAAGAVNDVLAAADLPACSDQGDTAVAFWAEVLNG